MIFLNQQNLDHELLNSLSAFKRNYEIKSFYLFSIDLQNTEIIQIIKELYFLLPPFAAIYEQNNKILEIDLKKDWVSVEEVLIRELGLKLKQLKGKNEIFQTFLSFLETILLNKRINGLL